MSDLLKAALKYAEKGYKVFPLAPGSKMPLIEGGKGYKGATADADTIRQWWADCPAANIGLALRPSGLVAVDPDLYKDDCEWNPAHYPIGKTWIQDTARGGQHIIYKSNRALNFPGKLAKSVEIKWNGYIVLAPSVLAENDGVYTSNDVDPAPAPEWLTRLAYHRPEGLEFSADEADIADVRAALTFIENPGRDWDFWNKIGGAVFNATGGSEEGFRLFDEWSQKSDWYNHKDTCEKRWNHWLNGGKFEKLKIPKLYYIAHSPENRHYLEQQERRIAAEVNAAGDIDLIALEDPAAAPGRPETSVSAPGDMAAPKSDSGRWQASLPLGPVDIYGTLAGSRDSVKAPKPKEPPKRFDFKSFDEIQPSPERNYVVKGLLPRRGLVVTWGEKKGGKSFWTMDVSLHVAFGWDYYNRRVQPGAVAYCSFEGATGFPQRIAGFRQHKLQGDEPSPPFYLMCGACSLVTDKDALIGAIREQVAGGEQPLRLVVLDTLNRSLEGSESNDQDMSAFVRAADAIVEAFDCCVIVVHHCGHDTSRPRGHTALMGAADAQIGVKESDQLVKPDDGGELDEKQPPVRMAELEFAKDMAADTKLYFRLKQVEIGEDVDGDQMTTCVVDHLMEGDLAKKPKKAGEAKLGKNARSMLGILTEAGEKGLTKDEWHRLAKEEGIGAGRKSDRPDAIRELREKAMIREQDGVFFYEPRM